MNYISLISQNAFCEFAAILLLDHTVPVAGTLKEDRIDR
jgi:hypothetical protein